MTHQSASETDGHGASRLGRLWAAGKRFGKKVAAFQSRALMTFFYFVIFAPFGLATRGLSDPLSMKAGSARGWRLRVKREKDVMQRAREQA